MQVKVNVVANAYSAIVFPVAPYLAESGHDGSETKDPLQVDQTCGGLGILTLRSHQEPAAASGPKPVIFRRWRAYFF